MSTRSDGGIPGPASSPADIAVFYPPGIDRTAMPPSLAVINEPEEAELPASWTVVPQFYSQGTHNVASIEVEEGTSLYGTGQVTGPLLRNGRNTVLWNIGNFCYEHFEGRNLYQSHPWVLAVRGNGSAFGVIFDTTWFSEIDLGERIRFTTDGPPFRVIVIARDSPQAVVRGLAELTGTMPLPPKWALGFQQCRMDYNSDSRLKEIADEYRRRKLPCDVIWADIHFMEGFRVFTFDAERFPDPKAANDYLHKRGFRAVWTSDPGIKAEPQWAVPAPGHPLERQFYCWCDRPYCQQCKNARRFRSDRSQRCQCHYRRRPPQLRLPMPGGQGGCLAV